jgi:hypothetical protein
LIGLPLFVMGGRKAEKKFADVQATEAALEVALAEEERAAAAE